MSSGFTRLPEAHLGEWNWEKELDSVQGADSSWLCGAATNLCFLLGLVLQREVPGQKSNVVRVVTNKSLKKSGSFICSSDSEIIGYALDTLYNVISNDLEEEEQGKHLVVIVVLTVALLSLVLCSSYQLQYCDLLMLT